MTDDDPPKNRAAQEAEAIRQLAASLNHISGHLRDNVRTLIQSYRQCKISKDSYEVKVMFLEAEGTVLQQQIRDMYGLYRTASRDLAAMRRVLHGDEKKSGYDVNATKRSTKAAMQFLNQAEARIPADPYLWDTWDGIRHLRQRTREAFKWLASVENKIKDRIEAESRIAEEKEK